MQIWQESFWQCEAWQEFWTNFEEEAIIQNCSVIEAYISINVYIYINRDNGIEIPEAWMPTIKQHRSRSVPGLTAEGTISSLNDKD